MILVLHNVSIYLEQQIESEDLNSLLNVGVFNTMVTVLLMCCFYLSMPVSFSSKTNSVEVSGVIALE